MAIVASFAVTGMNSAKYDEIIRALEGIGEGAPDGRIVHLCYGDRENLQVIDVYESAAQLAAFGAKLMPILASQGVTAVPAPVEAYNVIQGTTTPG